MTTSKVVTYEECNTYLKCVQRNMNCKPRLMRSTRSRNNLNLITPSEMLLGRKVTNLNLNPQDMDPQLVKDPILQQAYKDRQKYLDDLNKEMSTSYRADENIRSKWRDEKEPYPIGSLVQYIPKTKYKARPSEFPKAIIKDHIKTRSSAIRDYNLDFGANNENSLLRNRQNRTQVKQHDDFKLIYTKDQLEGNT